MKRLSLRFKNNSNLAVSIILMFGIVILLNWLSFNFFWRQDLTATKQYSISPATKQLIKNLPDVVTVKVYFSRDLPGQFLPIRQSLTDTLSEFQSYNHKFKVEYIDPKDGKEAEAAGIPKLQFNDWRQDKLEVVAGYMGLVINYGSKSEVLPMVQDTANFEYELAARIKKLISGQSKIGLVFGHEESDLNQVAPQVYAELSRFYELNPVSLKDKAPSVDALLLVDPKTEFNEAELKFLDKWLVDGKGLLILINGMVVGQDMSLQENKTNLIAWLDQAGLKVKRNLVLDKQSGLAGFNQGIVNFSLPYPFWPVVINENFDQNNPVVASLEGVLLPWVSQIELSDKAQSAGATVLAKSSRQAWLAEGSVNIDPAQNIKMPALFSQYNLAVSWPNAWTSLYNQGQSEHSRLIVVGDADFVWDKFAQNNPANLVFMQNLLDGVSLDQSLAGIRAKKVGPLLLKDVSETNKLWLRYGNIFAITVLVLLFGLARYYWRKKTKSITLWE